MKKQLLRNFGILILTLLFVSCSILQDTQKLTPKQKLTMTYAAYNSQYASYMSDTGYILDDKGKWGKISSPILSEDKKILLRKKKVILTKIRPLILIYDKMVNGIIPHSIKTENSLFALIDEIALLISD